MLQHATTQIESCYLMESSPLLYVADCGGRDVIKSRFEASVKAARSAAEMAILQTNAKINQRPQG